MHVKLAAGGSAFEDAKPSVQDKIADTGQLLKFFICFTQFFFFFLSMQQFSGLFVAS